MKDTIKYLVWIFAIVPFLIACGDSNTDDAPTDDFDVRFELPATVDVAKGGELTFTVKEGKSPLTTDSFLLEGGGISYLCPILRTSSESFTVRLADECESGSYTAYLKRDARKNRSAKSTSTSSTRSTLNRAPAPRSSVWYLRRKVPSRTSWYPTAPK